MRQKIYAILVNKKPGITSRYHKFHDGAKGMKKYLSWMYLLWLNFAYYILFIHSIGRVPEVDYYEEKVLDIKNSESKAYQKKIIGVEAYVEQLCRYDVISFDIFDTLILRPLGQPADVFYLIGEKLLISGFRNIRIWAEWDARMKCSQKKGHMEITLKDIWKNIQNEVGVQADIGMKLEIETEMSLCYRNPFMVEVWKELLRRNKRMIVVSDMYLPKAVLEQILQKNGFMGYEKLYVSCEYEKNKASGSLFEVVKRDFSKERIVHVGDNPESDEKQAGKKGFATLPYRNVNCNMHMYRPYDMSYLVGSAYRGLVSSRLYNGVHSFSMEYEYGYIYGGLFAVGYCSFIHDYCRKNNVDRILFLSRDGDTLKQVYDYLYPDEDTVYVYWSRKAATKLEVSFDKHDFFRRFIYHKVNQNYSIREVMKSMELEGLLQELKDLDTEDMLTDKNVSLLRQFLEAKWAQVIQAYRNQDIAAKAYYKNILEGCSKVVAVDIGWAGSGAMVLRHLVEQEWKIPCEVIGMIAGTNTIHNSEPDASETFLQSGKLVAYLYSQRHNRDLLKKHDPNKDYNVFWELLLSSPTPQFTGFRKGNARRKDKTDDRYLPESDITLQFGKYDANQDGIMQIQKGILDFARDYQEHFKDFPYMFNISGRDAYAPMLVAAGRNEKYLKAIEKKFNLEINVN